MTVDPRLHTIVGQLAGTGPEHIRRHATTDTTLTSLLEQAMLTAGRGQLHTTRKVCELAATHVREQRAAATRLIDQILADIDAS